MLQTVQARRDRTAETPRAMRQETMSTKGKKAEYEEKLLPEPCVARVVDSAEASAPEIQFQRESRPPPFNPTNHTDGSDFVPAAQAGNNPRQAVCKPAMVHVHTHTTTHHTTREVIDVTRASARYPDR